MKSLRLLYLHHMGLRNVLAILVAILVAAGCVRLGFWQLERREQRRALNALAERRMRQAPVRTLDALVADTGAARYRAVELAGAFDYDNEFVLAVRSHQGSPGVNLITPLRIPGEERAVMVNRGWVYAPDGVTVDLARWREASDATVRGYALPLGAAGEGEVRVRSRSVRRLEHGYLAERLPYSLATVYIVDTASVGTGASTPARLGAIALDEGPHLSYAMQWFSFAAIALIGVVLLVRHDRHVTPGGQGSRRPTPDPAGESVVTTGGAD